MNSSFYQLMCESCWPTLIVLFGAVERHGLSHNFRQTKGMSQSPPPPTIGVMPRMLPIKRRTLSFISNVSLFFFFYNTFCALFNAVGISVVALGTDVVEKEMPGSLVLKSEESLPYKEDGLMLGPKPTQGPTNKRPDIFPPSSFTNPNNKSRTDRANSEQLQPYSRLNSCSCQMQGSTADKQRIHQLCECLSYSCDITSYVM